MHFKISKYIEYLWKRNFVETNCGSIESKIKNNMVKLIFKFNFKTKLDISVYELKFDFCDSGVSHVVFWEENIHLCFVYFVEKFVTMIFSSQMVQM